MREKYCHTLKLLPNGDVVDKAGISAAEAVGSFSQHVAKEMLAVKINGQLRDVSCRSMKIAS